MNRVLAGSSARRANPTLGCIKHSMGRGAGEGVTSAHPEQLWTLQVKEHVKVLEMSSEEGNTGTVQSIFPPFVSPLDPSFQLQLIKLKA